MHARFAGEDGDVRLSPRSKAVPTVEALEQPKKDVDGHSHLAIGNRARPEFAPPHSVEPDHHEQEDAGRHDVQGRRYPRQQVES